MPWPSARTARLWSARAESWAGARRGRGREGVEAWAAGGRVSELDVEELDVEGERRVIVEVVQHPHFGRVVEQTVAAAHAGLAVARGVPGESEAGAEILLGAFRAGFGNHIAAGQFVAGIEHAGRRIDEMRGVDSLLVHLLDELILAVVEVGHGEERLPAQAEIERETRGGAEAVAGIEAVIMLAAEFQLAVALYEIGHGAQDVVRLVESAVAAVETVIARGIEHVVLVIAGGHQLATPGEAVT